MPSLLDLTNLFNSATQGDPLAKAAMPAAQNEFLPPPPITPTPKADSFGGFEFTAPDISAQPPQAAGPVQAAPEQQGRLLDDPIFRDSIKVGLSGLLGAGLGKMTGLGGGNVAAGAIQASVKDLQQKQQLALQREQRAWEDAYEEAKSLPSEIYNRPELEELLKAQQELMNDLRQGKVNNSKSLSNFLMAKSKYSREIDDIKLTAEIERQKVIQEKLKEAELQRNDQVAIRYRNVLVDPMATPAEKQQAEAFLAEHDKVKNDIEWRKQMADREANQFNERMDIERKQLEQGDRRLNVEQKNLEARLRSNEEIARLRGQNQRSASLQREIQNDIRNRLHAAQASGETADINQIEAEVYKQKVGITDVDNDGNIGMFGGKIPAESILGPKPDIGAGRVNPMWDLDGTPSKEGWARIIGVAKQQLSGLSLSSLAGAYGDDEE